MKWLAGCSLALLLWGGCVAALLVAGAAVWLGLEWTLHLLRGLRP